MRTNYLSIKKRSGVNWRRSEKLLAEDVNEKWKRTWMWCIKCWKISLKYLRILSTSFYAFLWTNIRSIESVAWIHAHGQCILRWYRCSVFNNQKLELNCKGLFTRTFQDSDCVDHNTKWNSKKGIKKLLLILNIAFSNLQKLPISNK